MQINQVKSIDITSKIFEIKSFLYEIESVLQMVEERDSELLYIYIYSENDPFWKSRKQSIQKKYPIKNCSYQGDSNLSMEEKNT